MNTKTYDNNTKSLYEMSRVGSDKILDALDAKEISETEARQQLINIGWTEGGSCGCLFPLDGCCSDCYPGA